MLYLFASICYKNIYVYMSDSYTVVILMENCGWGHAYGKLWLRSCLLKTVVEVMLIENCGCGHAYGKLWFRSCLLKTVVEVMLMENCG